MPVIRNKYIDKDSIHYVNDLYMFDAKIYDNYLNINKKKLYTMIFNNVKNYKNKLIIKGFDYLCHNINEMFNLLIKVNIALIVDHPELINYASFKVYSKDNETYQVDLIFAKNNKLIAKLGEIRIKRIITKINIKTKNMSDEEKIKYVYDWIGENNEYDRLFTYSSKNQSIYNVFINYNAVCVGFAKASQIIFQNIGIKSSGVVGHSTAPHMWNIIQYNNKNYYFDSTVAASIKNKNNKQYYDGLKQEKINSYTISNSS